MSAAVAERGKPRLPPIDGALVAVTLFSTVLAIALWYWAPIAFYPDSEQYVRTALAIINEPGQFYYYRTWGYPIFLILFRGLHTFQAVLVAQAVLGVAIPVVIYGTIRIVSRRGALLVAILAALSFAPFTWEKVIMTDQVSMFLYYALAYAAAAFIARESIWNLSCIALIGILLYLMRPSAALLLICTIACLVAFYPRAWRKLAIVTVVFLVLTQAINAFETSVENRYTTERHLDPTFVVGSMTGKMFFFNVYAVGPYYTGGLTVDRTNGQCSEQLYDGMLTWGHEHPDGTKSYLGTTSANVFADELFAKPTLYDHSIMWLVMDEKQGGTSSDGTFGCAAFEALIKHPAAARYFFNGFAQFFTEGNVVYNSGKLVTWDADGIATALATPYLSIDPSFPHQLLAELTDDIARHAPTLETSKRIFEGLFYWQTGIKFVATSIAIVLFPFCFFVGRRVACMAALLAIYLVYQAAIAVAFASPYFRYISPQIPMIIMLAGLGVFSLGSCWPSLRARLASGRERRPLPASTSEGST